MIKRPLLYPLFIAAVLPSVFVALPSTALAESACPNESIRAEAHSLALPECRAYELVTPPFKEGWPPVADAIAEGPEGMVRATGESFGIFAGAEGENGLTTTYLFTRGRAGWTASATAPPASRYDDAGLTMSSADLARGLWQLPINGQAEENTISSKEFAPYRREADGELELVGPQLPATAPPATRTAGQAASVVGASSDLSRVLLSINATAEGSASALWSGDETEIRGNTGYWESLYEYAGTGNSEPGLVGVTNRGVPPWRPGAPHLNEDARLISECGTELGSGAFQSMYNAVSAGGEAVFFTAKHESACAARQPPVDELYARIDGQRTIAISEPTLSVPGRQCTGACLTDETTSAGRREAIFEGASADGSKVFFLTQQPLVNEDEDNAMDLYMAEIAGEGEEAHISRLVQVSHDPSPGQAADVEGVARVSENGERVYFVAKGVLTTRPDLSLPAGHQTAVEGRDNLYVYDAATGAVAFVSTLASNDFSGSRCTELHLVCDWMTTDERTVQASEDGEYLLFLSHADLTPGDTSTAPQLFEYDAAAETLARVSIGQEGFNENGNIDSAEYAPGIGSPQYLFADSPAASETGRDLARDGAVFFESADGLTRGALNRDVVGLTAPGEQEPSKSVYAQNVYEYRDGQIHLISDGRDTGQIENTDSTVKLIGVTPSGTDALFSTADALVAQDTDTQVDFYDVRVNGGFPPPPPADLCGEGDCRGALGAPVPLLSAGGSEVTLPESNPKPATTKPKPRKLTRAQKLKRALRRCDKKRKHALQKRTACIHQARRRYRAKTARRTRRRR